jgi:NAD(P)H-dependent nitrite reductase large subunit
VNERLVLVGYGMTGHRLLTALRAAGAPHRRQVTVLAEETRPAYDRIRLSECLRGTRPETLLLDDVTPGGDGAGVRVHLGDPVVALDRAGRLVTTASGRTLGYDVLVLATGSRPYVPEVPGARAEGCCGYRTVEDAAAIRARAARARTAAVVGGGLLGLEAAGALRALVPDTHVVEFAPWLMHRQLDEQGGRTLRRHIEDLGVTVHTGTRVTQITTDEDGRASGLRLATPDGDPLPGVDADLVVFAAGVRPRDELARNCGLVVDPGGGIVVDESCRTSDPRIHAIGECALTPDGRVHALAAPGFAMADVVADLLLGTPSAFSGADTSTSLKLLDVAVASFGDALGDTPGAHEVRYLDTAAGVYRNLRVGDDGRLLGGVLVGDSSGYAALRSLAGAGVPRASSVGDLVVPGPAGAAVAGRIPDDATACFCHNVSAGTVRCAAAADGRPDLDEVRRRTRAGTGCGSCVPALASLIDEQLTAHDHG